MQTKSKILIAALVAAGLAFSSSAAAQQVGEPVQQDAPAQAEGAAEADAAGVADADTEAEAEAEPEPDTAALPAPDTGAQAEMAVESDHPAATNSIVVAPHIGALFPQLTSDLNTWPIFGLSAGYILPTDIAGFVRPLELGLDVMYSQPGADGSGSDPNLGATDADQPGDYEWELTQRMLIVEMYALWRFMPPGEFISAYGLIGPRAYFMESEMTATGNGGEDFGTNTQTNDEYGLVVGGGADFAVGPGTIYGTLEFGWSDLNQRITGDSNTGALTVDAGYRLYF